MWGRIYDSVIKSLLSVENYLFTGLKKASGSSKNNSFEIFGFDIMLDSDLK